jgi:hypothetical protein
MPEAALPLGATVAISRSTAKLAAAARTKATR